MPCGLVRTGEGGCSDGLQYVVINGLNIRGILTDFQPKMQFFTSGRWFFTQFLIKIRSGLCYYDSDLCYYDSGLCYYDSGLCYYDSDVCYCDSDLCCNECRIKKRRRRWSSRKRCIEN